MVQLLGESSGAAAPAGARTSLAPGSGLDDFVLSALRDLAIRCTNRAR